MIDRVLGQLLTGAAADALAEQRDREQTARRGGRRSEQPGDEAENDALGHATPSQRHS
jgi:hypothetical protein